MVAVDNVTVSEPAVVVMLMTSFCVAYHEMSPWSGSTA